MKLRRMLGANAVAVMLSVVVAGCGSTSGSASPASSSSPSATASSSASAVAPTSSPAVDPTSSASSSSTSSLASTPSTTGPASVPVTASVPTSPTAPSSKPTTAASTVINTTGSAALKVKAAIDKALLTPADVGKGFTSRAFVAGGGNSPCGSPSSESLFPNALRTGVVLSKTDDAELREEVSVFFDEAAAIAAHANDVKGLACKSGTTGGTSFVISDPVDIAAKVGADQAMSWSVKVGTTSGVGIAVRIKAATVDFTFAASSDANSSSLPDPVELVKIAVARLLKG